MRKSPFVEEDSCSIAQVKDNVCYIWNSDLEIMPVANPEIEYSVLKMKFYLKDKESSLNQGDGSQFKTIYVGLNIAHEFIMAFEDIERENEQRISRVYQSK